MALYGAVCFVDYLWLLTIYYEDISNSINMFHPMFGVYYHNSATVLLGIKASLKEV